MIKNLLYSLFIHFLLLLLIYSNFHLQNIEENQSTEIAVSLVAIDGDNNNSPKIKKTAAKKSIKKSAKNSENPQTQNSEKSPKQSPKNQISEAPKKLAESLPAAAKPIEQKKEVEAAEFKQPEKIIPKPQEVVEAKEDKKTNKNKDEKQNESLKPQEDLGLNKKDEEKQLEEEIGESPTPEIPNNIESLNLSSREKFNIQSQLKRCYARAIEESKLNSKTKISTKVNLSRDGYIESNLEDIIDEELYNNPKGIDYKIAVNNARRALDLCSPLRNLPLDKFDIWKEVIFEFGGEQLN
jgi:hypothetical protein